MTPAPPLPDGFAVRLHDDVDVGPVVVSGSRVLRLSPAALEMMADRSVVVTSPATAMLASRLLDLDLALPVLDDQTSVDLRDVSVVVPVKDDPIGVDRVLSALAHHMVCVIVDDGSADPGALAAVVQRHGATLVRLDSNVGPAAARDLGLRSVRTPLVAFIDADIDVTASAVERLAAHFTDPHLAAAAPRVRSHHGTRWFQRYDDAGGSLDLGPRSSTVRPWSPVAYVPSACLVARVDLLGDGFDPRLRCGEDVDLVWRLHDAGLRVRYVADVEVGHEVRRSVGAWLGRKAFYGTSAALLAQRHGDKVAPAVLSPTGAATITGVLLQRRWSWALAAGLTAWAVHDAVRRLPELSVRQRLRITRATTIALARQTAGLALRHWWPMTLLVAARSQRARRAAAVLAVADAVVAHRSSGADLDLLRFGLARRADDLAYGAGVWCGAFRQRSVACLLPGRLPRGGAGA